MTPIPFSIDLWQQGYRPVDKEGVYPDDFRLNGDYLTYRIGNTFTHLHLRGSAIKQELFLLPPEDVNEIVVDFPESYPNSGMFFFDKEKWANIPPGKYKLTKIG